MKKSAIALFFAAFLSITAFAQSVQEGINHYYAQRYASAKSVFDKLIAANPNNIEANYWLGQTYIAQKNVAAAKSLYDKTAAASNNAPLLVVGQGEIALLEGRAPAARALFESALAASKGRKGNDPNILDAVGRANADAYTESNKLGDLDYAIAKLNEAAQLAPTNGDIYLNLGNAYRKKRDAGSGGLAIQNFTKALSVSPNLAVAPYRAAMLYKTQVRLQQPDAWDVVLENLNNAIKADPRFAPAYYELYYYYLLGKKDFSTAENYANKYIESADPSVENDYLKAQTDFVQNKFNDAINIAKNILSQTNNNANPRVYRLLGYSYMGIKDTATACDYVNQFFTKATEDDIIGQDYILHSQSCGRNNPAVIMSDITKAVQIDSVPSRQIALLEDAARDAHAANRRVEEATYNLLKYKIRGSENPGALINEVALPYYFGGAYTNADSASKAYSKLAPDSIYGYYWSALSLSAIDTSTTAPQGLAMPDYEKVLSIAETDKVRYKSQGVRAAQSLAVYYNNFKNDKAAALGFTDRGLAFDPENANLKQIKAFLQQPARPATPARPNPPARSQTPPKTQAPPKTPARKG